MIEHYSFGSMTVAGKQYHSDLKIIEGRVVADWYRKSGHRVELDDIQDIMKAEPQYLIFGSGRFGFMRLEEEVEKALSDLGIKVIVELTASAVRSFNSLAAENRNIAAGFHLSC